MERVTVCIVCRRGPVFTLAGVLCAGSVENGNIFYSDFHMASLLHLGPRPLHPVADSLARATRVHGLLGSVAQGEH